MNLRTEFKPKIDVVRKHYSNIKKRILDYTEYCEKNGDENLVKYKQLETELNLITGKDISKFNLSEWWEEDGIENLSFNIALPKPEIINKITEIELLEIITSIKKFENPTEFENDEISMLWWANKNSFHKELLKINFKQYKNEYFNRNKDKNGNYFEYSIKEIAEKLLND